MRKRNVLPILIMFALGGPGQLFAWDGAFFDLFQVPFSAREAALGGNHAAQADDVSTLVSNPAGFRSVKPDFSIGTVGVSLYNGPNTAAGDRSTVDFFGPLSIAYVGNGLGFGLFTNSRFNTLIYGPSPSAASVVTENLVATGGFAFRIPLPDAWQSTLDVGFSVPIFLAARSVTSQDPRGLLSSSLTPWQFVIDEPFIMATGISGELGILYTWNSTFSVGLAGRNLAATTSKKYSSLRDYQHGTSPAETTASTLPMDISVGIRWNPPIKMLTSYIDGFTILADYNDIFDFLIYPPGARHPLLHIGLGMEITLLEIVKLRAGFYQLLPSGGISIDLSFFTIDAAVFGRELSAKPWTTPVYGYMAGIRFHT